MQGMVITAPSRTYELHIGAGAVEMLGQELTRLGASGVALVTDTNVEAIHGERVRKIIESAGFSPLCVSFEPGETHKTLATVERLYAAFAEAGLNRKSVVVALGGGIVGDVAGFTAATFMRGMQVVQVPTTLVSQVDSSVGGKTGVNVGAVKNLVGAFWQPSIVLADTDLLATLPERELRAGMGEVAKYFALGATELLPLLSAELTPTALEEIVALCCASKASFVARDELDTGARVALNFGHTFAHAIEAIFDYERYNHGEAVAIGMRLALEVGAKLKITPQTTVSAVTDAMERAGLDTALPIAARELVPLMTGDKKNTSGDITLVLLEEIGKPILHKISPENLENLL